MGIGFHSDFQLSVSINGLVTSVLVLSIPLINPTNALWSPCLVPRRPPPPPPAPPAPPSLPRRISHF